MVVNYISDLGRANGHSRFRYVALQMLEFRKLRVVTTNSVDKILRNLPPDLNGIYDRIFRRLLQADRPMATCALRWVVFSRVPLSPKALEEAILVDMHNELHQPEESSEPSYSAPPFDEGERFDTSAIKDLLPGLLEEQDWKLDEWGSMVFVMPGTSPVHDPVLVVSHFSLVEYLSSRQVRETADEIRYFALDRATADARAAETCLRYLGFAAESHQDHDQAEAFLLKFPLVTYAAKYGLFHAEQLDRKQWSARLRQLICHVLPPTRDSKSLATLKRFAKTVGEPSPDTSILYAISRGLWRVASFLVEQASDAAEIECPDATYHRTPLSWAAGIGRLELVHLLLQKGANPDSRATSDRTPLSYAAQGGHQPVVQLLLDQKGVDPDSKSQFSQTPLYKAAMRGHVTIVRVLLDRGADPDTESRFRQTPLIWAAARGHDEVVGVLLSTGRVNIDMLDEEYQTPLSWAAAYGHASTVKLLLGKKARVNTSDIFGRTPLQLARMGGFQEVAHLLEATVALTGDAIFPDEFASVPAERRSIWSQSGVPTTFGNPRNPRANQEVLRRVQAPPPSPNEGGQDLRLHVPIPGEHRSGSLEDLLMACQHTTADGQHYWPERLVRRVMTKSRVLADLEEHLSKTQAMLAVGQVFAAQQSHDGWHELERSTRCYIKTFAMLVILGHQEDIFELIRKGISDQSLPIVNSRGNSQDPGLSDMTSHFPDEWTPITINKFAELQWQFCSPFFGAGKGCPPKTPRYRFDERVILPFVGRAGMVDGMDEVEIDPWSHAFHDILREVSFSQGGR